MIRVVREGNRNVIHKTIIQGQEEYLRLTLGSLDSPTNLVGYTASFELRKALKDATVIDTLTTVNGRITLFATSPNVVCYWNTAKTNAFLADLIGDLKITKPSGEVEKVLRVKLILEKLASSL